MSKNELLPRERARWRLEDLGQVFADIGVMSYSEWVTNKTIWCSKDIDEFVDRWYNVQQAQTFV
jgi:hypothetical protein